jgi:hypothetical protein
MPVDHVRLFLVDDPRQEATVRKHLAQEDLTPPNQPDVQELLAEDQQPRRCLDDPDRDARRLEGVDTDPGRRRHHARVNAVSVEIANGGQQAPLCARKTMGHIEVEQRAEIRHLD